MRTKVCFKCDAELSITNFYKHPRMGDGHLGKCKACTRYDVRENRKAHVDYYNEYDRVRSRKPERGRAVPPERQHGAAALALHAQPFGFTREDVLLVRALLLAQDCRCANKELRRENGCRDCADFMRARSLADRIEAFLPPEAPCPSGN